MASKRASQGRWLGKPENQQYFCGPQHVSRVQAWRKGNPGHGGESRIRRRSLQETRLAQASEPARKSSSLPLQEARQGQGFEGVGQIGAPAGAALQDVM
jgi:hypothetical protein